MSRWKNQFENHPFQKFWGDLIEATKNIQVDDESITTDVEEIARLRKVVEFIQQLILACDPEFVPATTWQNFNQQCQPCVIEVNHYINNRNIQHIVNANANVDNLLTYIRPYVVEPGKAAKAAQSAFVEYSNTILEGLQHFKDQTQNYSDEFKGYSQELIALKTELLEKFQNLKSTDQEIQELYKKYFEGNGQNKSVEAQMDGLAEEIEGFYNHISEYYKELTDSGSDSIEQQISLAKSNSESNAESIEQLLQDTKTQLTALKSFYKDVVGQKDEDGNFVGGLKNDISGRIAELEDFKTKQETKYTALINQIEELIPGATSAGLAAAYRAMRKSFSKPIKQYSILFYVSIGILSVTAFLSTIDSFWTANEIIKFVDVTDVKNLISNLTHKLPIILPVLWLALFASKRRSEAQRLQQEYAHKEALAKSYQSFKLQVDSLGDDKKEALLEKLLGAAIDAVASNASDTLDKKHGDKTPVHEGLEKTVSSLEKIKGIFN